MVKRAGCGQATLAPRTHRDTVHKSTVVKNSGEDEEVSMKRWGSIAVLSLSVWLTGCQRLLGDPIFFAATTVLPGSFTADTPLDNREERALVTFPLVVRETQLVLIGVESAAVDTYLEVVSSQGEILAADDDHGPDVNSLLLTRLTPGTYTIRVLNTPGSLGRFTLGYRFLSPWSNVLTGSLQEGDTQHPDDGSWMASYDIPAQARSLLFLELSSEGFSPFLQLLNPDQEGVALAYRQESPLFLAVYLEHSGPHTVRVSSTRPGQAGSYRLNTLVVSPSNLL